MTPSPRNATRAVRIGSVVIGGGRPVVVQSMCATKTTDVEACVAQIEALAAAGAGVVRLAADRPEDVEALRAIRARTDANLAVDLQENYRLAEQLAPLVQKIRYNPGHLYHHERERPWEDKVQQIVAAAVRHDCAIRVGVNCGSIDPARKAQFEPSDRLRPMLASALEHCEALDRLGFSRYCVSLKDSHPSRVVEANRRFASQRPDVPLHLGVTEAGMPPEGIVKTRSALGPLLAQGIGDTIRVSLTVPAAEKAQEIEAGRRLLDDVAAGQFDGVAGPGDSTAESDKPSGLNIVSCPSCARVENEAFVELARRIRDMTRYAADEPFTIAVMGCRVNGPGETDDADLGVWCGSNTVHLKRAGVPLGTFGYHEILDRLKLELDRLIAQRRGNGTRSGMGNEENADTHG